LAGPNQIGTAVEAKSLLRGAHIFQTMSNTFYQGGGNFFQGRPNPCAPPSYEPDLYITEIILSDITEIRLSDHIIIAWYM